MTPPPPPPPSHHHNHHHHSNMPPPPQFQNGDSSQQGHNHHQYYYYNNHDGVNDNGGMMMMDNYSESVTTGAGASSAEESSSSLLDNVGTQDMTTLSNLTVEGINENLKIRYEADLVYTYTGTILISVNPYKDLNIYGPRDIARYHNNAPSGGTGTSHSPHIFAIAEQAYNSLSRSFDETTQSTQNQSVVISGESGAGKTETTKFILQYLCTVTSRVLQNSWVENQILEANTILESFGNAKTIRNDNSSRFGKFMQVCFDSRWMIRGCIIQDYLLEQSRITFQSPGERNYHVFYQLINAARKSMDISDQYALNQSSSNPTQFAYLQNQHDHSTSLDPLLLALQVLQIPGTHVTGIFCTISAILHLGNLNFTPGEDGETATLTEPDKITITTISRLLQVDEAEFMHVLLTRQINVRGNITEIPLRINEASENRHAMSKALYSRCFGWLIGHINERTNPGSDDRSSYIGLLDIFGFENFASNSFEQLCINFANEKLHKFFNAAVFSHEQEIYKAEGLNISEITFTDNCSILELIEKPPRCILKLLTEQCHLPKGSDLGFLNNLHSEFDTVHPCYEKGDDRRNWEKRFTIKHYAGSVTYDVKGFVEKNRDVQQDLFFNTLGLSNHEFVRCLANSVFDEQKVAPTTIPRNTSKGRPTVAETFRGQLQQLVEVLGSTKAWYVRCIKPNEHKAMDTYDQDLVLEQLKYLGMLEIIRIRKEGYPVHMPFDEFSKRYRVIGKFRTYKGARDTTAHILETLNPELPPPPPRCNASKSTTYIKANALPPYYYQLGNNKAFLKPQMHELLEGKRLSVITRHVTTIQKTYKAYKARNHFTVMRAATVIVQRAFRSWKSRILFLRKRRAAITIQCYVRGFFAREVACALREMRRVEEELRKREIERKRMSLHDISSDDGRESRSVTSDEDAAVIGGNKDVSLDNLFEFLLVSSGNNNNNNNNNGGGDGDQPEPPPPPSSSSSSVARKTTRSSSSTTGQQLDRISDAMENLVQDLNGIDLRGNNNNNNNNNASSVTNSNSVCSSMSNFEFDADESLMDEEDEEDEEEEEEVDDDEDDDDGRRSLTPTNEKSGTTTGGASASSGKFILPPPPPSPPPLIDPSSVNIPLVAKKVSTTVVNHNRLPEPTEKPPPPPPQQQQQQTAKQPLPQTQQKPPQLPPIQQQSKPVVTKGNISSSSSKKGSAAAAASDEPIYESIQPRVPPPPPPQEGILSSFIPPPPHYAQQHQLHQQHPQRMIAAQGTSNNKILNNAATTGSPKQQQPFHHHHHNGFSTSSTPPQPPPPPPQDLYKPIQQPLQTAPPPPPPQQSQQPLPPRVEKRVQEIIGQQQQQQQNQTATGNQQLNKQQQHQSQARQQTNGHGNNEMASDDIVTFKQYALQYFSLENRKQSQSQEDYIAEHTSFTKKCEVTHPHCHLYDPANVQVACFMFRDLGKVMKGELKPETETQALQTIIGYGIERPELRDEIYVQILRQTLGNGNVDYLEHLYLVFCLAIVSFPPGKVLSKVINYELSSISTGNSKLASQIKWILDNLQDLKIRGYVRKLPPSSVEIQAMKRLGTIVCRFFFLDGRTKAIDIHPTDTAYDAIVKLGEKIGVSSPSTLIENGWAIYQVRPLEKLEEHVPSTTYVYDVIAHWELSNIDKTSGVSLGCGDNRFVFKKRLFKGNCREIPQDVVECALLYAQAVFAVVKKDDYPVAEKVALQMAGLQLQVLLGEPPPAQNPPKLDNYKNVESFLPVRVARTRPHATWVPILAQAHRTYGAGKSELVSRVWYLSCVMQYPLYGTTIFHVVYRGYWVYGNSISLGISSDGISMIKSDDKFVIYEYGYNQIESVSIEPQERLLTITLNRSLPPDTHKCFVFETNHTQEVAALISSYCPALSSTRSGSISSLGVSKPNSMSHQLTNQDRMRLYTNVLNARRGLVDSGLLKKPEKSLAGVTFLKNTLRRLSKHKIERMRMHELAMMAERAAAAAQNSNVTSNGENNEDANSSGVGVVSASTDFPLEWFCFSKHAISTSLTLLPPELETCSVWIFGQLLAFSSYNPPANTNSSNSSSSGVSSSSSSPMKGTTTTTTAASAMMAHGDASELHAATVLQGIFEKVWRSDPLLNELYVQVIKQTTDHPEPNSRVNARNWGVLSLICSIIAPPEPAVRKYLNAHLKRCAITDFVTEEGKFARFAEKCLQHSISSSTLTSRRQWPPSKQEIICTVNRKPISARFHFMDGKYHTLQFAPNDTASDLLTSLTTKIGLPQGIKGYAIYEVSTSPFGLQQNSSPNSGQSGPPPPWERSLMPHEKPVEVIARWERQKANSSTTPSIISSSSSSASTSSSVVQQPPLFKFIIRKHLFHSLDLSNPIEKELVYHQLLSSARNDRFPVNDTEAAMLVALQAQVELGDYSSSSSEFPDYVAVSAHCLPTRIAALVSHESVARHHQSLVGTPAASAKQAVLNLLQSWPLFRCIVFDVTQSFTSNWPRNLWLALDNTGLHLLPQRTRHTLCTFEYQNIKSYSPSPTSFMLVTRGSHTSSSSDMSATGGGGNGLGLVNNANKIVLSTNQAYQIAQLIKEFVYTSIQQQQAAAAAAAGGNNRA